MIPSTPKRIVLLSAPVGETVAHHTELGEIVGEYYQIPGGEIYFSYREETPRRWYVNQCLAAFHKSVDIFNRFCELHAQDENTDNETAWSPAITQLIRELEQIEPLGDPKTSLWSATIHDSEWGLLSLH
ncbi:MAG: hypothetical protein K0Q55_3542 [Verrucomicrobia bacterium]|jgi:hypothetical protein|nr:hypothetical protein [Verrucomicrobiota bacterium]